METFFEKTDENSEKLFENHRITYSYNISIENLDLIEPIDSSDLKPRGNSSKSRKTRSRSKFEKKTLSLFIDKNNHFPKKEYLRCQIIRGVKRAIRESKVQGKYPTKKLHAIDSKSLASKLAWEQFIDSVRENSDFVSKYSSTQSGPLTDGKSSRKTNQAESKSFNDRFCQHFFSEIIRTSIYSKYLILIFTPFDCKTLQRKFNFRPAGHISKSCSDDCNKRWNLLKEYISLKMIQDLGCYEPEV